MSVAVKQCLKHQSASINMIRQHADIPYVFLIGGFGAGKSMTDVMLCMFLYSCYVNSPTPITIGILGVTIKLLKQTVLADLERAFDAAGIPYRDNSQAGTLTVGQITFVYLAMQNPDDIYAFNFHAAICDEIDEVPADRVKKIVTAIQERCRAMIPASLNGAMPAREPFIFFSTTAQGLGGTYMLTEEFKKNDVPYAVIRARTADNPYLAPGQLKLLRKLYTPEEAEAFLEGKFVNLSVGRVYPEFAPNKHIYMRFPIRTGEVIVNPETGKKTYTGETIYVGQDFNAGYNAAVMLIERGGKIHAVDCKHWNYVGDAAHLLREMYPTNRIVMIPDANGKEIMSGFVEEFDTYDIEIWWNNVNPSVTERITGVNKGFRFNQLDIFEGLDELKMCLQTRDFDDTGKPRKGKGPKALDHWGDAFEYGYWHIIHQINGYEMILEAIRAVHHVKDVMEQEAA